VTTKLNLGERPDSYSEPTGENPVYG